MVSRREVDPTYENFMEFVRTQFTRKKYPQICTVNYKTIKVDKINSKPEQIVQAILNEYNFVGLVERLDESLVVLRLLLGLDAGEFQLKDMQVKNVCLNRYILTTGDILYLSSKRHGK